MGLLACAEYISGGRIRNRIIRQEQNALYLLFPEAEKKLCYYGLLYADQYAEEIGAEEIVIITASQAVQRLAERKVTSALRVILLGRRQMSSLMLNLSYHRDLMGDSIYERLICISDKYPLGKGQQLIRESGMFDDSYFVWNRIYHRKDFYSADPALRK